MNNPYKELSPYIESDAHCFKGRSVEISEMYESFDRHEYLVCHADSGEGKSSIIEAGLIPKMKANCYFPIRIIFKSDEHFKNKDVDFDNVICGIINNEIEKLRGNKSLSVDVVYPKRLTNSDERELTDWEQEVIDSYAWLRLRYARITIDNLIYTPVLIFDQFEEVFTNPQSQEWTDKFFAWLQELSMDLCPQRIINELEKRVSDDAFPEIETQKHFKAIFSLRSEYVGKLDYWGLQRHYIPLLKNNRYLLRPLTIKGAKEVITQQDGYDGLNAVADEIIDILRKQQRGKNYVMDEKSELPCIPALFLSIICSRTFSMSQEERTAFIQRLVAEKDEDRDAAINSLIEGFYEKAVAECGIPSNDMGIIEDVLVNNEGSRQRVSSHADVLKAIDFSTKYMKILKDARLIRVIPEYNREDDSVEFVHDALCPIIAKRKELRLAEEAKKREEKKLREQAKKSRRQMRMIMVTAIGIVTFGILLFLLWQSNRFTIEQEARNNSLSELNHSLREQIIINERQEDSLNLLLFENEEQRVALNKSVDELNQQLRINGLQKDSLSNLNASLFDKMHIIELQKDSLTKSLLEQQRLALSLNDKNSELERQIQIIKQQQILLRQQEKIIAQMGNSNGLAYSRNGKYIAIPSADKSIRICDSKTGEVVHTLRGHTSPVSTAAFSPDDRYIVSASYDGTIRVWSSQTGRLLFIFEGHSSAVMTAVFSPNGKYILSASNDKTIRIWSLESGESKFVLKGHTDGVNTAFYSPDGRHVVSASNDNTIRIWDSEKGMQIGRLEGHSYWVNTATFSPDGKKIVSSSWDKTVRVWDALTGRCIQTITGFGRWVNSAVFSPDGKQIAVVSENVSIWDIETGTKKLSIVVDDAVSVSFSPDGKQIAVSFYDNTVNIYDLTTGTKIANAGESFTR